MKWFACAVALLVISDAAIAFEMPTQAQIDACRPDAIRLCGSYLAGDRAVIRACMLAHRPQLSQQCRDAFRHPAPPKS
jgi:hypothetical protein